MSYIRAEEVLPKELIETIQQYVNGKAIYIPSTSIAIFKIKAHIRRSGTSRNNQR